MPGNTSQMTELATPLVPVSGNRNFTSVLKMRCSYTIERKVEVNDGAPKERDSLANEALELIFDSASKVSFDGFTDSE